MSIHFSQKKLKKAIITVVKSVVKFTTKRKKKNKITEQKPNKKGVVSLLNKKIMV